MSQQMLCVKEKYYMKNMDEANILLQKANDDFTALSNMIDDEVFSDGIFGFHMLQTIEKSVKAWLAFLKIRYPKTHNINSLLQLVEQNGYDISPYDDFIEYSIYAVQYRYDQYDGTGQSLDRHECIRQVSVLLNHVDRIIIEN